MTQRRQPEFPKPFDFVSFPEKVERRFRPGHDSFKGREHLSGRMVLTVHVMGMIHVSSGSYALTEDLGLPAGGVIRDFYRVMRDGERIPAIPGSTLKGATRAIVEAVTASCIGVTRVYRRDLPDDVARSCRPPRLCPACGLFGAMSRYGRLSFGDAVYVDGPSGTYGMSSLYRPRPRDGRDYRTNSGQFKGRKFYFHGQLKRHKGGMPAEVLAKPSRLAGVIEFTSLTPAELGLLCFGLGLDRSFQPALGAGKPLAMGRFRVEATALHLLAPGSFTQYEAGEEAITGEGLPAALDGYLAAARPELLTNQVAQLRQILDPANDRPAPTGVY